MSNEFDRFDFEQKILECWNITKDIRDLNEQYMNSEMTEDNVSNYLLGLETIYEVKFDQLFNMFEKMIHEGKIT